MGYGIRAIAHVSQIYEYDIQEFPEKEFGSGGGCSITEVAGIGAS
jgi:hypothetical protein